MPPRMCLSERGDLPMRMRGLDPPRGTPGGVGVPSRIGHDFGCSAQKDALEGQRNQAAGPAFLQRAFYRLVSKR